MNVLVVGNGLLGSHLIEYFGCDGVSKETCDLTIPYTVQETLLKYRPDVVINCAGIVPKHIQNAEYTVRANALGPKYLADACNTVNAKLIHISTDCVFDGVEGGYVETDVPYPTDLYGVSKYLGEVTYYPHLTIRTSFVGLPDPNGRGLLSWAQQQKEVVGYDKVFWNGLTTVELGKQLFKIIYLKPNLSGLLHLYGETVSKLDILVEAGLVWGWDQTVVAESTLTDRPHVLDRTLASHFPDLQTKKPLFQMLTELRDAYR